MKRRGGAAAGEVGVGLRRALPHAHWHRLTRQGCPSHAHLPSSCALRSSRALSRVPHTADRLAVAGHRTGGSRGIGLAIALKLAREAKANVCIAAKTCVVAFPSSSPGLTSHSPLCPVPRRTRNSLGRSTRRRRRLRRREERRSPWSSTFARQTRSKRSAAKSSSWILAPLTLFTAQAIEETASKFHGIDIVINNASAISLTDSQNTPVKVYDLMSAINGRGTYLTSKVRRFPPFSGSCVDSASRNSSRSRISSAPQKPAATLTSSRSPLHCGGTSHRRCWVAARRTRWPSLR